MTPSLHAATGFALDKPHDAVACERCHASYGTDQAFAERYPGRDARELWRVPRRPTRGSVRRRRWCSGGVHPVPRARGLRAARVRRGRAHANRVPARRIARARRMRCVPREARHCTAHVPRHASALRGATPTCTRAPSTRRWARRHCATTAAAVVRSATARRVSRTRATRSALPTLRSPGLRAARRARARPVRGVSHARRGAGLAGSPFRSRGRALRNSRDRVRDVPRGRAPRCVRAQRAAAGGRRTRDLWPVPLGGALQGASAGLRPRRLDWLRARRSASSAPNAPRATGAHRSCPLRAASWASSATSSGSEQRCATCHADAHRGVRRRAPSRAGFRRRELRALPLDGVVRRERTRELRSRAVDDTPWRAAMLALPAKPVTCRSPSPTSSGSASAVPVARRARTATPIRTPRSSAIEPARVVTRLRSRSAICASTTPATRACPLDERHAHLECAVCINLGHWPMVGVSCATSRWA